MFMQYAQTTHRGTHGGKKQKGHVFMAQMVFLKDVR